VNNKNYLIGLVIAFIAGSLTFITINILWPRETVQIPVEEVLTKTTITGVDEVDGVKVFVKLPDYGLIEVTGGIIYPEDEVYIVFPAGLKPKTIVYEKSFINRTTLIPTYIVESSLEGVQGAETFTTYSLKPPAPYTLIAVYYRNGDETFYRELALTLSRNITLEIIGRVLSSDGKPLKNSLIEVYWTLNANETSLGKDKLVATAVTNSHGYFLIRICNLTSIPFTDLLPKDASFIYVYSVDLGKGIVVDRSKSQWIIEIKAGR